jgi:hypothetical protein
LFVLQAFAEDPQVLLDLEPLQLARLWKALLLLRDCGVTPPPQLMQVNRRQWRYNVRPWAQ